MAFFIVLITDEASKRQILVHRLGRYHLVLTCCCFIKLMKVCKFSCRVLTFKRKNVQGFVVIRYKEISFENIPMFTFYVKQCSLAH